LVLQIHYHYSSDIFFINDTSLTNIYTLSLHDALPIYGPFELLIKSKFKTIERIENIDSDVLIIYSLNDEVIPYRFSKKVMDKGNNIESLVLEEESHNNILNNEMVFIKIGEFIR